MNHNMPAPNRMPNPSNMMGMGGQPGPPPQHPQHFPQPPVNGAVPIPPSPSLANTPQMRPSSSMNMRQSQHNTPQSIARAPSMESMPSSNGQAQGPPFERNVLDRDAQGIKRKNETEDEDSKRTRQKTGMFSFFVIVGLASEQAFPFSRIRALFGQCFSPLSWLRFNRVLISLL